MSRSPTRQWHYAEAIADYAKIVELLPNHADGYTNRGYAYQLNGEREKAIADYRKALSLDPTQVQARENLRALGGG